MSENTEEGVMAKSEHAKREERILAFWLEKGIFEKTLAKESPKGNFTFYEGPPTANGKPAIHHVEARVFKDAIPRYKTMQGFHVPRRAGWDTHGLPVELQVEKELGLKSKKEIESYGVEKFNRRCKESVFEYIDLWKKFTNRVGYWADLDNAYFTFDNSYIESLWHVVGRVNHKKLLYKDYKVVPWCARCGTGLSSHELAQGYQDVKDLSVYVKFKISSGSVEFLKSEHPTYFLAWTTTPWTLPGNVGLAVGSDIDYVKAKVGEDIFILAESRLSVLQEGYEIVEKVKGKDLVGLSYDPLYPFLKDNLPQSEKEKLPNAFKVWAADFVTTEDGTGIVHTAVMYGADDFVLGTKENLPKYHLVEPDGHFKAECGFLAGKFVKPARPDDSGRSGGDDETAVEIIKDLASRALLFKKEKYEHSYPHCWRCKTPLIYYARDSWYIAMSRLRDDLVMENEKINWEPSYIREGRFGEWLREIKDWAISRERYWGTPLPVWLSEDNSEMLVVDSIETLKKHTKRSGNTYLLLRHGKTPSNEKGVFDITTNASLSENGKAGAVARAAELKAEGIVPDLIFASPFNRTKESATIISEALGLSPEAIIFDDRLVEWNISKSADGKSLEALFKEFNLECGSERHFFSLPDGESFADVMKRMASFIYDIESKYKNKKILIVSHAGPLKALFAIAGGKGIKEMAAFHKVFRQFDNSELRALDFAPLPHNENFDLDLHKPFIDSVELVSESGKPLKRVKEVMDVWFDSGAMPFAEDHYPFENEDPAFPADYISEAIDQTRGWFYTLHAVGVLMGRGRAYKNVICLGHLLDKNGKKMSKSLGNVLDPWEQMDKFGADALRLWMYSVNQPGESKNYDEKTVDEINKKVFNLLTNVSTFYELYRDKTLEFTADSFEGSVSEHALDKWLLVKLEVLVKEMAEALDGYKLLEPVRALRAFIDDMSTWYLQLSRDRFREGDAGAKQTLYFTMKTLSKLLAPFAPFFAEDLYQKLRNESDVESVHLEAWPETEKESFFAKIFGGDKNEKLISDMEKTRKIVSMGLDLRMKANIKVRQPLLSLTVSKDLEIDEELQSLVSDRVNVKKVLFTEDKDASLDTAITAELKEEGIVRELVRFVQDLRKKEGLTPNDKISLTVSANASGKVILEKSEWSEMLKNAVLAKHIEFGTASGEKLTVEDSEFTISIIS